jgi:membrane fusion protein, multidrug efflux system
MDVSMRGFLGFLALLLCAAAAVWVVRPAGIGDPGGLIAMADQALPQAVALRAQYYPWADKPVASADASAPPGKGDGKAADAGGKGQGGGQGSGKGGRGGKGGPAVVVTKPVEQKSIPVLFSGVGTVQSMASIALRPHLDGQIMAVTVAEGALVQQGDLLFRLDDRALKAQLAQAMALIQKDQAQLDQNGRDLARAEDLLKQKFLTPQSREAAQTSANLTKAQLAVDMAQKAGIETSLSFAQVTAPVSGRIGSIAAKAGSFARTGDVLATVNQVDPIYVAFALPQARLPELRAAMAKDIASVRIKDAQGTPAGKIAFIENTIDAATGTVQVKAAIPNGAEALWPGAFAAVELQTGVDEAALVVPSVAVLLGQQGPYVYAVVDKKAVLKLVTIARVSGPDTVVASGLAAGDEVVVQGQGALTDGAEVRFPKEPSQKKDDSLKTSSAAVAKDG